MALKNYFRLLSIELIEHILLQLTRPSDLLSLALTERSLCLIIIPHFLDYCRLAFPIERADVWKHLNEHPLFCSRVRHLKLWFRHHTHNRPEIPFNTIVPRSLKGSSSLAHNNINEICSVLAKMSNLKWIAFYRIRSWNGRYMTPPSEFFPLALAVHSSGCELESIEVHIPISNSTKGTSEELELSFLSILSDENWLFSIKKFSFCFFQQPLCPLIEKNFQTTLFSMVNLTHLRLDSCSLAALFTDVTCYWPNLEFFYFKKENLPASEDFDVEFISRHTRLRMLYLERVTLIQRSPFPDKPDENIVPSLISLTYTWNILINGSLNNLSRSVIRNLTHLTLGARAERDLNIFEGLEALESCIIHNSPVTRRKEGVIQTITCMSRGCRNLRKLAFYSKYLVRLNKHDPVFSLFQDLPNLTHLLKVSPQSRQFPGSEGDTLLKKLYQFPKLKYIDCSLGSGYGRSYVELRRNDMLQQMEYEILEYIPESCDRHQWGGGFRIPK